MSLIAFVTDELAVGKNLDHLGPSTPQAEKPPPPVPEILHVAEHGDGWGVPAEWESAGTSSQEVDTSSEPAAGRQPVQRRGQGPAKPAVRGGEHASDHSLPCQPAAVVAVDLEG